MLARGFDGKDETTVNSEATEFADILIVDKDFRDVLALIIAVKKTERKMIKLNFLILNNSQTVTSTTVYLEHHVFIRVS